MTDERAEPATSFNFMDAPAGDRYDGHETLTNLYRRLHVWNRGDDIGNWVDEKRERHRDYRGLFEAIGDFLEVTDYQEMRAWEIFAGLPEKTHQGNPTPALVFCAYAIACWEDGRAYHPTENPTDTRFEELIGDLDTSRRRLATVYHRVDKMSEEI